MAKMDPALKKKGDLLRSATNLVLELRVDPLLDLRL